MMRTLLTHVIPMCIIALLVGWERRGVSATRITTTAAKDGQQRPS